MPLPLVPLSGVRLQNQEKSNMNIAKFCGVVLLSNIPHTLLSINFTFLQPALLLKCLINNSSSQTLMFPSRLILSFSILLVRLVLTPPHMVLAGRLDTSPEFPRTVPCYQVITSMMTAPPTATYVRKNLFETNIRISLLSS